MVDGWEGRSGRGFERSRRDKKNRFSKLQRVHGGFGMSVLQFVAFGSKHAPTKPRSKCPGWNSRFVQGGRRSVDVTTIGLLIFREASSRRNGQVARQRPREEREERSNFLKRIASSWHVELLQLHPSLRHGRLSAVELAKIRVQRCQGPQGWQRGHQEPEEPA